MKNRNKIRKMAISAILIAISIVLQFVANSLPPIGIVSLNLGLIPILMGAILLGPVNGGIIGLVVGAVVLFGADVQLFLSINGPATIILCLVKTSLAGVISSLAYVLSKKCKKITRVAIASILVPLVNTGIFVIGSLIFFNNIIINLIISGSLFVNLGVELLINILLIPTILYLTKSFEKYFN
jgi:uncharacterized membrane protein